MKKARVIITQRCSRNCSYCCNKHEHIRNAAIPINNLGEIPHRDEINITGGEPMEVPFLTHKMLFEAQAFGFKTVYLYTARYTKYFERLLPLVDGVQFTLHAKATRTDIVDFHHVQNLACLNPEKSFRLAMDGRIQERMTLIPRAWTDIKMKLWRTEENVCIPPDETLYVLRLS